MTKITITVSGDDVDGKAHFTALVHEALAAVYYHPLMSESTRQRLQIVGPSTTRTVDKLRDHIVVELLEADEVELRAVKVVDE